MARAVLIYDLAKRHLVEELKYPPGLIDMEYDKEFAIMVSYLCHSSKLFYVTAVVSYYVAVVLIIRYLGHTSVFVFCSGLAYADVRSL